MSIYFISGHIDLTPEEFSIHYEPYLLQAKENPIAQFIVGDAPGCDTMVQIFLKDIPDRVTIYCMYEFPRNLHLPCKIINGFKSDEERDSAMTKASTEDIAWVRPITKEFIASLGSKYNPKRKSGTQKNIDRRKK